MTSVFVSFSVLKRVSILICLYAIFGLASCAGDPSNPYLLIAARNAFGLKPPPTPAPPAQLTAPRPGPKLVLTGVADFGTDKWAFVSRTDPGKPPKNYTLSIGDFEGGLQLVGLNANAATATLIVDELETVTLHLQAATNAPPAATHAYTKVSRSGTMPLLPRR